MKSRKTLEVFHPGKDDRGRRIDRVLRKFLPEAPLGGLYRALRLGKIRVNGKKVKQGYRLDSRDEITVDESLLDYTGTKENHPTKGDRQEGVGNTGEISKLILYEDDNIAVLNKPRGLISHGPSSLDEKVKSYLEGKIEPSLSFRPGPLHRLDRNTSGIIMFSKTLEAAQKLSGLFADTGEAVQKYYLGLTDGPMDKGQNWESLLRRDKKERKTKVDKEGKAAKTLVLPLITAQKKSLCLFRLESGRSHQIRAQAEEHRHPLSGDTKYNGSPLQGGYLLHACCIKLAANTVLGAPDRKDELFLYAPPPANFIRKIEAIFGKKNVQTLLKSLPRILREEDFSSTLKKEKEWE